MVEATKRKLQNAVRLSFQVPGHFVGAVVGKGGSNIRKAREIVGVLGVEVSAQERDAPDEGGPCSVVVTAESPEAAEGARDLLGDKSIAPSSTFRL